MKPHNIILRLVSALCLLAAVLFVVAWQGISQLRQLNAQMQVVVSSRWEEELLSHQACRLSSENSQITLLIFLVDDQNEIQQLLVQRAANAQSITRLTDAIKAHLDTEKGKQLFAVVGATGTPYLESYQRALALLLTERKPDAARKMMVDVVRPNLIAYGTAWGAFNQYEDNEIDQVMRQGKVDFSADQRKFLFMPAIAGLIAGAIAIFTILRMGREISIRHRAEQSLQLVHHEVEARVVERTAELAKANEVLQVENAERKKTEETLQRQQTELRVLFDLIPALVWFKDTENRILRINQRAAELAGKSIKEIEGKSCAEIYPREAAKLYADDLEIIHSGAPKLGMIETIRGVGGKKLLVQKDKVPYYDKDGKVIGIVAMAQDITERKKAEKALHENEEKFRQLADNISAVFWITSPDLKTIRYVSPGYRRIWGRLEGDLYANPHQWVDAILPEQRERVFDLFTTLTGKNPEVSVEYQIVRPDGTVRWVHDRGFQVRDAEGNVVSLTGVVTDITERKQAEESIQHGQTLARMVGRLSNIGAWSAELPVFKVVFSDEVCAIHEVPRGFSPGLEEAINFYAPEHRDIVSEAFGACMRDGTPFDLELQLITAKGRRIWVRSMGEAERDAANVIHRVQGVCQDITERKRLEAQLFQSQKLETVGKLAGGVAHEFNSILTAIIGQGELLLGDLPAGSPLVKNATEISNAAMRAASLTRQLLAYGRKQILQPEILDLNSILAGMDKTLRHLLGRGIDLRLVPAAGPKMVKADSGQIEQAILNLAVNAADAMPEGGKLTLETANVMLDLEYVSRFPELKAGEYVMLAITDTGAGMSKEAKAHVFEPFFTTKDVGKGAGLGLSTCYGIIKQSGGHVSVYSELGHGTTFKIYLPQVDLPAKFPVARAAKPDLPHGTESILLVEDDPALREMAATLLSRLGYTVLAAANGIEALSLMRRHTGVVDLLFTDMVMPQMNGKELSERVQELYPQTRILFTSAYTQNAIIHQGVLNQGVAMLQKPFTPGALAHKIREVLDQPSVSLSKTASIRI